MAATQVVTSPGTQLCKFQTSEGNDITITSAALLYATSSCLGDIEPSRSDRELCHGNTRGKGWVLIKLVKPDGNFTPNILRTIVVDNGLCSDFFMGATVNVAWLIMKCNRSINCKIVLPSEDVKIEVYGFVRGGTFLAKLGASILAVMTGCTLSAGTLIKGEAKTVIVPWKDVCEYVKELSHDDWLEMSAES